MEMSRSSRDFYDAPQNAPSNGAGVLTRAIEALVAALSDVIGSSRHFAAAQQFGRFGAKRTFSEGSPQINRFFES